MASTKKPDGWPNIYNNVLLQELLGGTCMLGTVLSVILAGSHYGLKHPRRDLSSSLRRVLDIYTQAQTAPKRAQGNGTMILTVAAGAAASVSISTAIQLLKAWVLGKKKGGAILSRFYTYTMLYGDTMDLANLIRYLVKMSVGEKISTKASNSIELRLKPAEKDVYSIARSPCWLASVLAAAGVTTLQSRKPESRVLGNIRVIGRLFSGIAQGRDTSFAGTSVEMACMALYDEFAVNHSSKVFGDGHGVFDVMDHVQAPLSLFFPTAWIGRNVKAATMVGAGDVLLPARLISLALRYDHFRRRFAKASNGTAWLPEYVIASLCGYSVGLVAATQAVGRGKTQLPGLLYLSPCTILPILGLAWYRGELAELFAYDASVDGTAGA